MPLLSLHNISKRYGATPAVDGVSLEIERGEFFGLLGPSGCGKTTTLRMIAGLESPDIGTVNFDDQDISQLAPERRGFGMVFQNYALFPHLNLFENVAFGLRSRGGASANIKQKVSEALDLVQLPGFEKRRVDQLSGGQQQRVAIARAIAIEPSLLLFDEPLSNLDVALREETRAELRSLVKRLNLTAVYVTHDQEEAFALCDRLAVMHQGRVLQVGTPRDLYLQPANVTVAKFLGRNNLIRAVRLTSSNDPITKFKTIEGSHTLVITASHDQLMHLPVNKPCVLAIRPESILISRGDASLSENQMAAVVEETEFSGAISTLKVDANGLKLEVLVVGDELIETRQLSLTLPSVRIRLLPE
jgi:iron(III) transport system ATP-binding protein